jgi:hypothetical protein
MQDTPVSLRSLMTANGDGGKQIWATEFGVPTGGSGAVTEAAQAQMVTDAYKLFSSYSWAGPLFWYTGWDTCTNTTDRECWFGLFRGDGSHKLGYDAYYNSSKAAGGTTDTTIPTTSITMPTNGSNVYGSTQVQASANDNIGVTKVEFYLDGALSWTETGAPYCYQGDNGSICNQWDTTKVTNGGHTFYTKAYDAAGNVGTSPSVTINVNNQTTISTYTVSGNVSKSTGGSLSGSKVTIYNSSLNRTVNADGSGNYSFSGIANGTYTLTFSKKKYQTLVVSITVLNNNVVQNITLSR